jgi:tryptophan 7-halogenase
MDLESVCGLQIHGGAQMIRSPEPLRRIVIAGGGSAGWMSAAAAVNAVRGSVEVTLVESEAIGIVGVGEATIPPIRQFNQALGLSEAEFLRETQGSIKLGIEFVNWGAAGSRYFHPFGTYGRDFDAVALHHYWLKARAQGEVAALDEHAFAFALARQNRFIPPVADRRMIQSTHDYAYHFDAALYGQYLRRYAEARGAQRVEGRIAQVRQDPQTGFITALDLDDGRVVEGDFFIDCTGFRAMLIGEAMGADFVDWAHWLPCDRAVAAPSARGGDFTPYTRSTAHEAGWQWRIPLQHRTGNGHVHCSAFISEEAAVRTLLDNLDGELLDTPRTIKFRTGRRSDFWRGNCVAIGLAAGFMEPLESTSLHLIQSGLQRWLALFPSRSPDPGAAAEYNRLTVHEYERIRDFLILHYHANTRDDGELWRYCRTMAIPDTLAWKIDQFRAGGRLVSGQIELFLNPSWLAVLVGQGVEPQTWDPLADLRGVDGARQLAGLRKVAAEAAAAAPGHAAWLDAALGAA